MKAPKLDRKSTRLNSSHTVIYTLSLHDALPIYFGAEFFQIGFGFTASGASRFLQKFYFRFRHEGSEVRSEEHTSELQSHSDLHSFPTRRSSDLFRRRVFPDRLWLYGKWCK